MGIVRGSSLCKSFENAVGKGKMACDKQFLLFPVFTTLLKNFQLFLSNVKVLSSANFFNLEESKICRLGKAYSGHPYHRLDR